MPKIIEIPTFRRKAKTSKKVKHEASSFLEDFFSNTGVPVEVGKNSNKGAPIGVEKNSEKQQKKKKRKLANTKKKTSDFRLKQSDFEPNRITKPRGVWQESNLRIPSNSEGYASEDYQLESLNATLKSAEETRLYFEIERFSKLLFRFYSNLTLFSADHPKSIRDKVDSQFLIPIRDIVGSIYECTPTGNPIHLLWLKQSEEQMKQSTSDLSLQMAASLLVSSHPKFLDFVCVGTKEHSTFAKWLWGENWVIPMVEAQGWTLLGQDFLSKRVFLQRRKDRQNITLWMCEDSAASWLQIQAEKVQEYLKIFPSALFQLSQLAILFCQETKILRDFRRDEDDASASHHGLAPFSVVQLVYWYLTHVTKSNDLDPVYWPVLGRLNKAHSLAQASESPLPHLGRLCLGFFEYYSSFKFEKYLIELQSPARLCAPPQKKKLRTGLQITDSSLTGAKVGQLSQWLQKSSSHFSLGSCVNDRFGDALTVLKRPRLYQRSPRWARLGHLLKRNLSELELGLEIASTTPLCPPRQPSSQLQTLAACARALNPARWKTESLLMGIMEKGPLNLQEVEARLMVADASVHAEVKRCGGARALLEQMPHVCWLENLDVEMSIGEDEEEKLLEEEQMDNLMVMVHLNPPQNQVSLPHSLDEIMAEKEHEEIEGKLRAEAQEKEYDAVEEEWLGIVDAQEAPSREVLQAMRSNGTEGSQSAYSDTKILSVVSSEDEEDLEDGEIEEGLIEEDSQKTDDFTKSTFTQLDDETLDSAYQKFLLSHGLTDH